VSEIGDARNEYRAELDGAASEFMADLCDIILLTPTSDTYGGSHPTSSTVASNVPCGYETLSKPIIKLRADGTTIELTEKLTLPSNSTTQAITDEHRIDVKANGNTAAFSLASLTVLPNSLAPFVTVAAYLSP
jgi:hypothetical protein